LGSSKPPTEGDEMNEHTHTYTHEKTMKTKKMLFSFLL
jgi:hypothetical protein